MKPLQYHLQTLAAVAFSLGLGSTLVGAGIGNHAALVGGFTVCVLAYSIGKILEARYAK